MKDTQTLERKPTTVSEPVARGEVSGVAVCRHHWIIESASGPVSKGACRFCGQVKQFKNYLEASPWGEDTESEGGISERYPVAAALREAAEEA